MNIKRTWFTILLVTLLILVMAVSVTGCGSSSAPSVAASTASSTAAATTASASENTNLDPITFEMFFGHSWVPADSFTGIIPEEITKRTGVSLNSTKAVDGNQLTLMIASNDLPELIYTGDERNRLSSDEFSHSWDDLIAQYAPDFELSETDKNIARSYSTDGKFYTIFNYRSSNEDWVNAAVGCPGQNALYYRQDIYEALGSPKLETTEDLLNVLEMVKQQYPDMIPYGIDAPYWYFQAIAVWLGYSTNDYVETADGSIVYRTSHEKYKDYLQYLNTMYRKGYFTAENYAIQSETDSINNIAHSGKAFLFSWYTGDKTISLNAGTQVNVPNAEWRPLGVLSKEYKSVRTPTGWSGVYISKNCKDPGRAIQFMQYMFSEEGRHLSMWGREGIDYTLDDKGVPIFSTDWIESHKDSAAFAKKYNNWFYLGVGEVDEMYQQYSGLPSVIIDKMNEIKFQTENKTEIGLAAPRSDSEEGIIKTKLSEMLKTEEAKCIFSNSDAEFNTNYDNILAAAKQIGVEQLNTYITDTVAEIRTKYTFD